MRIACFMGLVSFLAGRAEVLRVAPRHAKRLYNAAARAIIQSATLTKAPLTAAGLDGTGEIIQVRLTCYRDPLNFGVHTWRIKVRHKHLDRRLKYTIDVMRSSS